MPDQHVYRQMINILQRMRCPDSQQAVVMPGDNQINPRWFTQASTSTAKRRVVTSDRVCTGSETLAASSLSSTFAGTSSDTSSFQQAVSVIQRPIVGADMGEVMRIAFSSAILAACWSSGTPSGCC